MSTYELPDNIQSLYKASTKKHDVIEVPPLNYLMIDGHGDPGTAPEYQQAMEALYSVSYTLRFAIKKAMGLEYKVMPLEGLWWADNMAEFSMEKREDWRWTSMIMQPEMVTAEWIEQAIEEVKHKKKLAVLPRFETYQEGLCVQVMHLGPYSAEPPTIAALHQFIHDNGYQLTGKHHEIYLSDPRRSAPEKMKTIIRQPVSRV